MYAGGIWGVQAVHILWPCCTPLQWALCLRTLRSPFALHHMLVVTPCGLWETLSGDQNPLRAPAEGQEDPRPQSSLWGRQCDSPVPNSQTGPCKSAC